MDYYSIMLVGWDYSQPNKVKQFKDNGFLTPCDVKEVVYKCGSLYPFITTKKKAVAYANGLKKEFPFVSFSLMKGETFGEMELIQSF